jgi:hypothetical protein
MNEKVSMEDDGKRISGRYVVKNGIVTVTASNGRATRGVIEDSLLSAATLARALLLQLHRHGAPTDDRGPRTLGMVVRVPRISPDVSKALAHRRRRMSPNRPPGSLRFSSIPRGKVSSREYSVVDKKDPNQNETGVSLD